MLGLLKLTAAHAQATQAMALHLLESRGLSPAHTADHSATSMQALPLSAPPSIVPELSSMGIPLTAVDELCKLYASKVHQLRSTMFDRYQALVAELGVMPSAGAASRDSLHKAVSGEYLKTVARVKEHVLNAARRIADDRAKETSPFKETYLKFLEYSFSSNPNPSTAEKNLIAQKTGMALRQIDTWFQNKRRRTRKAGCNAAGYIVYDRDSVPTLQDVMEQLGQSRTGTPFDASFEDEEASDATSQFSDDVCVTVYESTSDDACDFVKPLPRRREHVFDSPVPAFVFPVKYPPPRKLVAAEKFTTTLPRQKPIFPRMRVAHITIDQLTEEFARLSVKPRIVRERVSTRSAANLATPVRRHPPTARPDRRAATARYHVVPFLAPLLSHVPTPRAPRSAYRIRPKPTEIVAVRNAPNDFARATPSSLVCPCDETPTGKRQFPELRPLNTPAWKTWRDVDLFAVSPARSFSTASKAAAPRTTPVLQVVIPAAQPTPAPSSNRKRSHEDEPSSAGPAPAKKTRTVPKPSLPHRRPTHAPVNTDRVRVRPVAKALPTTRTPTRRERTESWVSSQPRTPSAESAVSTPSSRSMSVRSEFPPTPATRYDSLDPFVQDDDSFGPPYGAPTYDYHKALTGVPVYPPIVRA